MISEEAPENGTASTSSVSGRTSAAASGRVQSENPDAKRKRDARAAKRNPDGSSAGGRGGATAKGNPIGPSFAGAAHMGEPLSAHEAERQLYYGHVGLAKAIRSEIDLSELKEEFQVAGENYAYVANHIWTPLRVVIRFIAPVVLVAVLVVIWGHMLAATPWIHRVRDWWGHRRDADEAPPPPPARATPASPPAVEQTAVDAGGVPPPPPVPQRPRLVRTFGHRL